MALYETEGIVLRKIKYSESSLIVDIYSKNKGLRSYMVSGSRSAKSSKKAVYFQLFSIIDIIAYDGDEDKLCHIKEVNASHHYRSLQSDVVKSAIATFMVEVVRNTIKEREADEDLFDFLKYSFITLDNRAQHFANFHLRFMLDLSAFAGFQPQLPHQEDAIIFDMKNGHFIADRHTDEYHLNDICSLKLMELLNTKDDTIVQMSNAIRQQLLDGLILYYRYHVDGFRPIKSLEILRVILT